MLLSTKRDKKLQTAEYNIGSKVQHYSGKIGTIAGVKIINHYIAIYLIEFMDHNRAWVTKEKLVVKDNLQ